jgi:hypothetical protein
MSTLKSMSETLRGMQNVEHDIIDQVRARKVDITARNFAWNYERGSLAELPDPVHMEVQAGSRHTSTDWPHILLQDSSSDRIDRLDVRQEIERIVDVLAPQT